MSSFCSCKTGIHYILVNKHRRQWIENRLLSLSNTFAIDIAAYAIMSNHYNVVLHIDKPKAEAWSTREICTHWHQLFSGFSLSNRFLAGEPLSPAEEDQLALKAEEWRQRLMDISWFMRCLNDKIIWNDFEQLCWP